TSAGTLSTFNPIPQANLCRIYFFFQAEDGIRDLIVTGVQTCALPISGASTQPAKRDNKKHLPDPPLSPRTRRSPSRCRYGRSRRSEERRVGKECRSLLSPDLSK